MVTRILLPVSQYKPTKKKKKKPSFIHENGILMWVLAIISLCDASCDYEILRKHMLDLDISLKS